MVNTGCPETLRIQIGIQFGFDKICSLERMVYDEIRNLKAHMIVASLCGFDKLFDGILSKPSLQVHAILAKAVDGLVL